jgi:hypothetical protein
VQGLRSGSSQPAGLDMRDQRHRGDMMKFQGLELVRLLRVNIKNIFIYKLKHTTKIYHNFYSFSYSLLKQTNKQT